MNLQISVFGAGAWMLISGICAGAATPEQLYQSWQHNYRQQPDLAEKTAKDYLRAAPAGPHARSLQIWLDAYHRNLDSLLARLPRSTRQHMPVAASAQAPRQTAPQQPAAAAPPPQSAPQPPPVAARTPQPAPVSAIPPDREASTQIPSKAPQDVMPAVKPTGRSLPEMLAFIADRLDVQGKITFTAQFHDMTTKRDLIEQLSYEASQVTIDPNQCRISFRWHVEQDQNATPDQNRVIELRLAKSIRVETIDRALSDINAEPGHRFSVRARPQLYAVHIDRWDKSPRDNLYFRDREMATRAGEAAMQALGLCGDGRKGKPGRQ